MEFFIVELLVLSSAGSVLTMILGMVEEVPEIHVPNLSRFTVQIPSAGRPAISGDAEQHENRFDEAA